MTSSPSDIPFPAAPDSPPCEACAQAGTSCCRDIQIFLTRGDVRRIGRSLAHEDFFSIEEPLPYYRDDRNDPEWRGVTTFPDGRRRVLRRDEWGRCVLLGPRGCLLKEDSRPLLCRIHPYDFNRRGLIGLCDDCPIARHEDREDSLNSLGMTMEKVKEWHKMLYEEIDEDNNQR